MGETYPVIPDRPGYVARFGSAAFDIAAFDGNIKAKDVREFSSNPLSYGVFRYGDGDVGRVPFLVIKIAGTDWNFDVSFNLPLESERTQSAFLSSDDGAIVPIVLCDYPSGKVRTIRAIGIDKDTLNRIRETCRTQQDADVVRRAIEECYLHIPLNEMIKSTNLRAVK